jgi:hypothetical protein
MIIADTAERLVASAPIWLSRGWGFRRTQSCVVGTGKGNGRSPEGELESRL